VGFPTHLRNFIKSHNFFKKENLRKLKDSIIHNKAVAFLSERNKVVGEDFQELDAVSFANKIAFDEEVEKQKERMSATNDYICFDGDEGCSEDCRGWDGVSGRCDCGNRRLYWSDDYCTFHDPCIYPEVF